MIGKGIFIRLAKIKVIKNREQKNARNSGYSCIYFKQPLNTISLIFHIKHTTPGLQEMYKICSFHKQKSDSTKTNQFWVFEWFLNFNVAIKGALRNVDDFSLFFLCSHFTHNILNSEVKLESWMERINSDLNRVNQRILISA